MTGAFLAAGAYTVSSDLLTICVEVPTFGAFELEAVAAFFAGADFFTTLDGATKSSEPLSSAMRNPSLSLSDILSGWEAVNWRVI